MINRSPHPNGNILPTQREMENIFKAYEAARGAEDLQTMRTLARNMTFLMRSIELGKEKYGLPEREAFQRTNFIR